MKANVYLNGKRGHKSYWAASNCAVSPKMPAQRIEIICSERCTGEGRREKSRRYQKTKGQKVRRFRGEGRSKIKQI